MTLPLSVSGNAINSSRLKLPTMALERKFQVFLLFFETKPIPILFS
jgi:hypothetical protein